MKTIKKLRRESQGSILILTMLALVGAISIAVAMSSISIVERKMTTKSRKSTTAFQSANSGIEWAMKKINDAEKADTINGVFGSTPNTKGQVDCDNANMFSSGSGLKCKITFLKRNSLTGERDLIRGDAPMEDVVAIRSSGTFGSGAETVGRALEAYAMPNCGASAERVADFCIDNDDKDVQSGWGEAVTTCEEAGKRLCTASELVAAAAASVSNLNVDYFSADVTALNEYAIVNNSIISSVSDVSSSDKFRCCRNR